MRVRAASDLERPGLAAAHAHATGVYSEPDPAAVARLLGWDKPADVLGPALVFPDLDPDGRPTGYVRLKPAHPRRDGKAAGKVVKYDAPRGRRTGRTCPLRPARPWPT